MIVQNVNTFYQNILKIFALQAIQPGINHWTLTIDSRAIPGIQNTSNYCHLHTTGKDCVKYEYPKSE